jgi:hypothetical protein
MRTPFDEQTVHLLYGGGWCVRRGKQKYFRLGGRPDRLTAVSALASGAAELSDSGGTLHMPAADGRHTAGLAALLARGDADDRPSPPPVRWPRQPLLIGSAMRDARGKLVLFNEPGGAEA